MKHSPLTGCSTYVFVILVMLVSFVLAGTAAAIGTSARRTSANYRRFASLYDIGVSACERMKRLLYEELEDNKDIFSEELAQRLKVDYESGLSFDGEKFILGDNHMDIFKTVREELVRDFLIRDFTPVNPPREYSFTYSIDSNTEVYNISVNAEIRWCIDSTCPIHNCTDINHRGINVRANVGKRSSSFSSMPINVFGRIGWRRAAGVQAELIPLSYGWRDSPPDWFKNAQSSHETISLDISGLKSEGAVYIVGESIEADGNIHLDADMFNGAPTMVINLHNYPLNLYGNSFRGIIITKSDIFINTLGAEGSIIAGGTIYSASGVTASPDILFEIETGEVTRRRLYDILGITNFAASGSVKATAVLKYIEIKDFEIKPVNLFEPVLMGVQQV